MELNIQARRWTRDAAPKKILVIRLQALGDTVITLPYAQGLKNQFPDSQLHLFTRREVSAIPRSLKLFDHVITLNGGRNAKLQFVLSLFYLPMLWMQRYDAVIDLQNNRITRNIRRLLRPDSWTAFDVYTPISAGERTLHTINALWSWRITPQFRFRHTESTASVSHLLAAHGYNPGKPLVALNPAGTFLSRNWPLEHYVNFAKLWLTHVNSETQFVLLLLKANAAKAEFLKNHLGIHCVDLTGKADQVQAFQVLAQCDLVLTEDSGLMHMAWVQGVPTIALFSSSRKDWSAPQGSWSLCLDSSDLACGPCELEHCQYHDNRCLTRYTADVVVGKATQLLKAGSYDAQQMTRPV